jgi:PAS domain S-box-containing protein
LISGIKILAIEDDPGDVELLRRYLREVPDLKLDFADRLSTGLKRLSENHIDLVILDFGLPDSQGLETLTRFRSQVLDIPVVVLTGMSDESLGIKAVRMGAQDYLIKGQVDHTGLSRAIRHAMERHRTESALRESEELFRSLFENSLDGILLTRPDGTVLKANPAACKIWRQTEEEICLAGTNGLVDTTDIRLPHLLEERRRTGRCTGELKLRRKDGAILHAELSSAIFTDAKGEQKTCMSVRDITTRRQAEVTLQETLADLARSNADLQQFAYVASHDLQEPLRNVASCLQMLEKDYKNKLDADADQYIHYAVDGAVRMKALILDLLAYSRVATKGKPSIRVDCEQTLDRTLNNLGAAISEAGAVITHDPLPTVFADDTQLLQVFQNLIGNAIKFRRDDPARIHVSAVKNKNEWIFSIKDNGIGIESRHLERIFEIFQRLHKRSQYDGTGMGLAIVKKVVERHGGRIWAESEPAVGTTFYFTIPEKGLQT